MRENKGEICQYFGKYRGTVSDNEDELHLGRIRAKVRDVYQDHESTWALPCVPYAGNGVGFFFIPPVGASVWIEFEQGDPDYPIWTGCFWDEKKDKLPASPAIAGTKVLKTETATITLDDKKGIITIETKGGASVKLNGNKVSINGEALEVE